MTLRIAKIEEPCQKRRVAAEKPVTTGSVQVDHPEPEVVGIPGLVQQMIGRFSCQDFDGVSNGYSHSARSTVKHGSNASVLAKSRVSSGSTSQRNLPPKIARHQHQSKETELNDKEPHLTKSSDLHDSRSSSKKVNQCNLEVQENGVNAEPMVVNRDSDSNRDLSKPISTRITNDAGNKKAPPLHPKSDKVLNLFVTLSKNRVSSSDDCNDEKKKLDNSRSTEVNDCHHINGQLHSNGSVGLSVSAINETSEIPNGQSHRNLGAYSSNEEPLAEMKKCNKNNGIDGVHTEEDGHYFLGVMSEVERELSKHCSQLEQFLSEPLTDEAGGKIRAAIGKASLLMTKKFKQFHELCHNNLNQSADEPFKTTSEDLTGFWDLVQLQVDDVQRLFDEIYRLHGNKWIDTEPEVTPSSPKVKEVRPKDQSIKSTSKKAKSPGTSETSKAREEARKRLLAAKMAGRQRKASETEEDIQIFIS